MAKVPASARQSPMAAATAARERALTAAIARSKQSPMAATVQQREAGLTAGTQGVSNWGPQQAVAGPEPTVQRPASAAPQQPQGPAVLPFLTPAQQLALSNYMAGKTSQITGLQQQLGTLTANTNAGLATAARARDVGTDNTNQALAARGLFQSSIRDADLNDIELTYANKQNALNTAMNTGTLKINSQIGTDRTNMTDQQNYYNQLMVQNANGITPPLSAPAPTQGGSSAPAPGSTQTPAAPLPNPVNAGINHVVQATQGSIAGYVPAKTQQSPMGALFQNRANSLGRSVKQGTSSWGPQTATGVGAPK